MEFKDFASTKEFQNLHPIKQQIIKEVVANNMNSSPEVMLPKIMSINRELSKRNLSFTREETNLLIRIMKSDMTPDEQKRVDLLMGLFSR